MKIMKVAVVAVALAFLIYAPAIEVSARRAEQQGQKQVRVYFWRNEDSSDENPHGVAAVTRTVGAASPARAALEALINGPTDAEVNQGYRGYGPRGFVIIKLLTIKNGTARVNFVSSPTWEGWPGELIAPRFKEAVTRTLKQFPNIRRAVVSLDGDKNFDSDGE